jgi:hypothetical protein
VEIPSKLRRSACFSTPGLRLPEKSVIDPPLLASIRQIREIRDSRECLPGSNMVWKLELDTALETRDFSTE